MGGKDEARADLPAGNLESGAEDLSTYKLRHLEEVGGRSCRTGEIEENGGVLGGGICCCRFLCLVLFGFGVRLD